MKKKNELIAVGVVLAVVLALSVWLFFFQEKPNTPKKIVEVSRLTIDHGVDWSNSNFNFTVTNLYNYPVTQIGSTVNGVNYGYSNLTVPPGQTLDESLMLPDLVVTSSKNFSTTLAFTFGNGQYQVSSQFVIPVKYIGAFFIVNESLVVSSYNTTKYSVTIQNTGTIPIVSANYTIGDYQAFLPLYGYLMPKESESLNGQTIFSSSFQAGLTYSLKIQVTYVDRSVSSAYSSVMSIVDETPTPTPTVTPTPHPSPTPTHT